MARSTDTFSSILGIEGQTGLQPLSSKTDTVSNDEGREAVLAPLHLLTMIVMSSTRCDRGSPGCKKCVKAGIPCKYDVSKVVKCLSR